MEMDAYSGDKVTKQVMMNPPICVSRFRFPFHIKYKAIMSFIFYIFFVHFFITCLDPLVRLLMRASFVLLRRQRHT